MKRGFEQGKSGGKRNGLETIIMGQVASDEGLCYDGTWRIDLGDIPKGKKHTQRNLLAN